MAETACIHAKTNRPPGSTVWLQPSLQNMHNITVHLSADASHRALLPWLRGSTGAGLGASPGSSRATAQASPGTCAGQANFHNTVTLWWLQQVHIGWTRNATNSLPGYEEVLAEVFGAVHPINPFMLLFVQVSSVPLPAPRACPPPHAA